MLSTQVVVYLAAVALKMRFMYSDKVAVETAKSLWKELEQHL